MAASYNDMSLLAGDGAFGNRVAAGLWQTCVNVSSEAWSNVHLARKNYIANVLNNPTIYKPFFINVASVDATVISDATAGGTVPLTSGNVGTQAALVTDAHIANAISGALNAFISGL